METATEQGNEPAFVSDKREAQPRINILSVGSPSANVGTAMVPIDVWTRDTYQSPGSDTYCHNFNTDAVMVQNSDGTWSYGGFAPGTTNGGNLSGPNCP
jgi:hypothetical protein